MTKTQDTTTVHFVPVASPDAIQRGYSGDDYVVPVDPQDANVCEACE